MGPHAWASPGVGSLECPGNSGVNQVNLGSVMPAYTGSGAALWTSSVPSLEMAGAELLSFP